MEIFNGDEVMGFEYAFKITETDIECLARCPDGIDSLEKLLRAAPHFIESDQTTFRYGTPESQNEWPANISIEDFGLSVCIYRKSADSTDQALMNYLIHELLDRCGHVEVEDL